MTSRHAARIDRSVRKPQWAVRIVTLVILAAGAAVIAYAWTRSEAQRERAVRGLAPGDTVALVRAALGEPPVVCPTGDLAHLEAQFPGGWPGAARGRAIEELRAATAERWVYPLRDARQAPCAPQDGVTEIGVSERARIVWIVPLSGRHPLRLPESIEPGSVETGAPAEP
jgi:hypothetical protein